MTLNFATETELGQGTSSSRLLCLKPSLNNYIKFYLTKNKNKNKKVKICIAKLQTQKNRFHNTTKHSLIKD